MIGRRSIGSDTRGVTLVEFAFVAPVMIVLLLGMMDLCYRLYVQSILTGAVQRAGRDGSLESGAGAGTALDEKVVKMVRTVAPSLTWDSKRSAYSNYGAIRPEPFSDTNSNGSRDAGECFSDVNGNGVWDADPGKSGQGYANETVVYTMNVHYPRLFPMAALLGWSSVQDISASTLLKNQPYDRYTASTPATLCT